MVKSNKIKKIVIFLGYSCNNKCIFCYNENKNTKIKLITNGRILSNKNFTESLLNLGINHIVFLFYGPNAEIHDNIVGISGAFNQLKKGIKNIKNLGFFNISSTTIIVKQNYKYLVEIRKFIHKMDIVNADFIFVNPNNSLSKKNFYNIVPTYENTAFYINTLLKFCKTKKISCYVKNYPLCFIEPEYHRIVKESLEKKSGRIKIEKCNYCKYKTICQGYWKEYVQKRPYVNKFNFDPIDMKSIKKISKKVNLLKKDPDRFEKIYFLLGLKKVLRLAIKNQKIKDLTRFLETYDYVIDKEKKYIFFSKDIKLAKKAKEITELLQNSLKMYSFKLSEILSREYNHILGNLYGYPSCCSYKFEDNKYYNVENKEYELSGGKLVLHYACSKNCQKTKALHEEILTRINRTKIKFLKETILS